MSLAAEAPLSLVGEHYHIAVIPAEEALFQLAPESIDSIVTDPPYGTTDGKTKLMGIYAGDVWPAFGHQWDQEAPLGWLVYAYTILKPGAAVIAFTDNQKVTTLWNALEEQGFKPLRVLYWHKTNPPTNPRKNFCSSVETAVFARKPGKVHHWAGGGAMHNFFQCAKVAAAHKVHPTQKPLDLMRWLVGLVTPPGGECLDPFMGGGTTGVAALELGCRFVGFDTDPDAVRAAGIRLERTVWESKKA